MFILDGKALAIDVPFEHEGVRFPANWLRLSSPEEKAALGITEIAEQPRPDDRYYWVTKNSDGSYEAVGKDLEVVREMRLSEIKATSYSLLSPTDYKFIRSVETSEPVDEATLAYRTAVREAFATHEAAINACTSVSELAALTFTWPE